MLVYASENDGRLPRAGGPETSRVTRTPNWKGRDRAEAYGMVPGVAACGQASISASFYLLVKYVDMPPRVFVCVDREGNMERGASVFDPNAYDIHDRAWRGLVGLWSESCRTRRFAPRQRPGRS